MFDEIVTNLLKEYVQDYVEEFTSDNLSIGVIAGTVELTNLFVKKDSFANLNLPFRVLFGYLSKATVEVPYLNLQSSPVTVNVRGVFLLLGPRTAFSKYNEKEEKARLLAENRDKIAEIEKNMELAQTASGHPDPLASDLVGAIVKNLNVTLNDIHICYEDVKTNPECPFTFGLTLKRLTIRVSELLYPKKAERCSLDHFRKDIILQFLSIYFNCGKKSKFKNQHPKKTLIRHFVEQIAYEGYEPKVTYLLDPCIVILSIWINRKPETSNYSMPKIELDFFIDNFGVKVNGLQLEAAMLLADTLGRSALSGKYRKWRPKFQVMDHPRAWWKFAIKSIIEAKLSSKRKWSWPYIKMYHLKVRKYEKVYLRYLVKGSGEKKVDELEAFLNPQIVVYIRKQVRMKMGKKKKKKENNQQDDLLEIFQQQLSSEDKEELERAMDAKPIDFSESYEAYSINVAIKGVNFCLIDKSITKEMLKFSMDNLTSNLKYRPTSQGVNAQIGINDISLKGINKNDIIINKSEGKFLRLSAEMNPLSKDYDLSLTVKLRKIDLIVHTPTIFEIMEMFGQVESEDKESDKIKPDDKEKTDPEDKHQKVERRNALALKKAIKKASILNMDFLIEPITIVIPDHGSLEEGQDILVLCTGRLKVTSSGGSKKVPDQGKQTESKLVQTLRKKTYETMEVNISGTKLILAPKDDLENVLKASKSERIQHILKPFRLDVDIMRSYIPNDPEIPLLKIKCSIPEITFETKHSSVLRAVKLLVSIPPSIRKSASKVVMHATSSENPSKENKAQPEGPKDTGESSKSKSKSKSKSDTVDRNEGRNIKQKKDSHEAKSQIVEAILGFILGKISYIIKTEDNRDLFNFCLETLIASAKKKTSDLIASVFLASLVIKGLDTSRNETINIFEAHKSKNLVQIRFEKINNKTKLKIDMSGFVLMIVIDYLMRLTRDVQEEMKKLAQKPPKREHRVIKASKDKGSENSGSPSEATKQSIIFIFRMPQIDIYIIESLNAKDPLAFVFGASAVFDLEAEGKESLNAHGGINHVQLGLTSLKKFQSIRHMDWYILTPFGFNFRGETSGRQSQRITIQLVSQQAENTEENNDVKVIISPFIMQRILAIGNSFKDGEKQEKSKEEGFKDTSVEATKFFSPEPIDIEQFEFLTKDADVVGHDVNQDLAPPSEEIGEESTNKQSLTVEIKSFTIVIESGGQDSQPLLKLFSSHQVVLDDWAERDLKFHLESSFYIVYHNENKFSWEPMIELVDEKPWQVELKGKRRKDENSASVFLKTSIPLELCLSKSLFALLMDLEKTFTSDCVENKKSDLIRNKVEISNFTGMSLKITFDQENFMPDAKSSVKINQKNNNEEKTITVSINQGKTINLLRIRELQSTTENTIKCILEYQDKALKIPLCLKRGGPRCFGFPVADKMKMEYEWIFKVEKTALLSKKVTFGTIVYLINRFDVPLRLYYNISKGGKKEMTFLWEIPAEESFYLPVNVIYSQAKGQCLWIRPSENYSHSCEGITWDPRSVRSDPSMTLRCQSPEKNENFYIRLRRDLKEMPFGTCVKLSSDHLFTTIKLYPMMQMRNLLPIPVEMTFVDRTRGGSVKKYTMKPGQVEKISNIDLGRFHEISMRIPKYLDKEWTCKSRLQSDWGCGEYLNWTFSQVDGKGSLSLAIDLAKEGDDCRIASLFSPFWMVNNTGKKLTYKTCDQNFEHPVGMKAPLLLCPKGKNSADRKISISFEDSSFSEPLSIASAGNMGNFVAKGKNDFMYCASVETELSEFILTNIVKISPFYLIINKTKIDIEVTDNDKEWTRVKHKSKRSLWPATGECFIIIRIPSQPNKPSKRISLKNPLSILSIVSDKILAVNVDIQESEIVVKVSDYFHGSAPVRIFNLLETPVTYGQNSVKYRKQLPPHHNVYFTWHDPSQFPLALIWSSGATQNTEAEVDISTDSVGQSPEGEVHWACFVYGQQRTLLITKDRALTQASTQQVENDHPSLDLEIIVEGIGISLVDDILQREVMYISITSSEMVWEAREPQRRHFKPLTGQQMEAIEEVYKEVKKLQESSKTAENDLIKKVDDLKIDFTDLNDMKVLEPFQGPLRRQHSTGIWIGVSVSEHLTQFHLKLFRLQVDNQMDGCVFPVVICRKPPPRSLALSIEPKPLLEISAVQQKQMNSTRFNYLAVLIQELMVQIDGTFLLALDEFFSIAEPPETNFEESMKMSMEQTWEDHIDFSQVPVSCKIHYDHIHISPIKAEVSFTLVDGKTISLIPTIDFLLRSVCIALSEFRGVVFKINFFERKNVLMDTTEMINEISGHYSRQILSQFYVVVLGFGVLGNPVGVLLGLGRGIGDLFYEPYLGIVEGPQEFVKGVGIGVRSLMKGTVGGAAGAMEKIAGTLGQGIATLSMDDEAIQKRQDQLNRRTNMAESGGMLMKGVAGGITGVLSKPVKGAQKEGVKGLMKGLGRGVVGMVADPVTGALDFASGAFSNVKNAVDDDQMVMRQRLPRNFYTDGILRAYSAHDALGRLMFKKITKGESSDQFVKHFDLVDNKILIFTDERVILTKQCSSGSYEEIWDESFSSIESVQIVEKIKVLIHLVSRRHGESHRVFMSSSPEPIKQEFDSVLKKGHTKNLPPSVFSA